MEYLEFVGVLGFCLFTLDILFNVLRFIVGEVLRKLSPRIYQRIGLLLVAESIVSASLVVVILEDNLKLESSVPSVALYFVSSLLVILGDIIMGINGEKDKARHHEENSLMGQSLEDYHQEKEAAMFSLRIRSIFMFVSPIILALFYFVPSISPTILGDTLFEYGFSRALEISILGNFLKFVGVIYALFAIFNGVIILPLTIGISGLTKQED